MSKGHDLQLYSACNLAYAVDFLGLFVVVGVFFVIVGFVLWFVLVAFCCVLDFFVLFCFLVLD